MRYGHNFSCKYFQTNDVTQILFMIFFQGLVIVEPAENLLFLDSEREFLTGSEVVIPLDIMSRSGHPVSRYRYLWIWIET